MAGGKIDAELIEAVVREVLRRLRAGEVGAGDVGAGRVGAGGGQPAAGRELVIGERVVTLATLAGRLDGIGRLVVDRRAVVTPAVRDELNEQAIEMVRR